jgi:hypothetical protein
MRLVMNRIWMPPENSRSGSRKKAQIRKLAMGFNKIITDML